MVMFSLIRLELDAHNLFVLMLLADVYVNIRIPLATVVAIRTGKFRSTVVAGSFIEVDTLEFFIGMSTRKMFPQVALSRAAIIAMGTLESSQLTAVVVVRQMIYK